MAKSQRGKMHNVLVIDSDPALAKKVVSALTKSGFEVMGDKPETEVYSPTFEAPVD